MTHDSGFAPNPLFGCLTLPTCMTEIRRTKKVGDWVAGFASGLPLSTKPIELLSTNSQIDSVVESGEGRFTRFKPRQLSYAATTA